MGVAGASQAAARFAYRGPERPPRRRAGSNSIACRSANSAENVMPTRRNGRASSHITGHSTRANNASGQHRTKRRHQATIVISVFIRVLHGWASRMGLDRPTVRSLETPGNRLATNPPGDPTKP
ncbi:hypothetical protein GCM10027432_06220 [Lysobacter fragariae]